MLYIKQNKLYFIIFSIIIFSLDQLTKYLININSELYLNKDFILFSINFVKNYGAAFNILSGSRIFLALVSFIISVILFLLIIRTNNTNPTDLYSYSFILGGTLGNGIDRIIKGYVIDFISLNFINFPVFNIADISINIGYILLLYSLVKYKT